MSLLSLVQHVKSINAFVVCLLSTYTSPLSFHIEVGSSNKEVIRSNVQVSGCFVWSGGVHVENSRPTT